MALNPDASRSTAVVGRETLPSIRPEQRVVGPDVVRAIALIGVVVMNYHGYLIFRGADDGDGALDQFFDPQAGPLATRFAATFVLVAGVGVTLDHPLEYRRSGRDAARCAGGSSVADCSSTSSGSDST